MGKIPCSVLVRAERVHPGDYRLSDRGHQLLQTREGGARRGVDTLRMASKRALRTPSASQLKPFEVIRSSYKKIIKISQKILFIFF